MAAPEPVVYSSKVSLAVKKGVSSSVRTTVPEAIAKLIGASPGSVLSWSVVPGEREAMVSVLSKASEQKRSKQG